MDYQQQYDVPFYFYPPPLPVYAPVPLPLLTPDFDAMAIQQDPYSTFPTPSELLVELATKDQPLPSTSDNELSSDPNHVESARKARRRAMAKSVGFTPTDPDIISSHEKKRHYLECLEQYVMFLHDQFSLIGVTPTPLKRVSTYRGLGSRSIRTLLVHMENTNRKLHLRTVAEEQRFMALRDEVMRKELLLAAIQQPLQLDNIFQSP